MDKEGASVSFCMQSLEQKLQCTPILLQIPIGEHANFKGVVDLITMEECWWDGEYGEKETRRKLTEQAGQLWETAKEARHQLVEQLAELDDVIMEMYVESDDPMSKSELHYWNNTYLLQTYQRML